MDPGLVESSGSLLLIAHLSLGRICFPTHKRSSSCFLFPPAALSSRDHRNPAASVRIAPEEEDPQRRRGKMVEGTGQEIPEARTLRPVGCNLAVQSRPQTFSSLARREYQGCSKVFSRLGREDGRNSWRRRTGPRLLSSLEISSESNRWNRSGWSRYPSQKIKGAAADRRIEGCLFLTLFLDIFRGWTNFSNENILDIPDQRKDSHRVYDKKWGTNICYVNMNLYICGVHFSFRFGRKETEKE